MLFRKIMSNRQKTVIGGTMRKMGKTLALVLVLGASLLSSASVSAQSNGLGITPRINLTSKPGGSISDSLRINNLSSTQPLSLQITLVDFKPANDSGTPQLIEDPSVAPTPWSLKPYLSLPEFITIPAGQSKSIPYTIKFPPSVGAGSYYSAIEYKAQGNQNQQKVTVAASSATLVFVNVEGNASELLSLLNFGPIKAAGGGIKSSFSKPPTLFTYRLKNSGNLNEAPAGSIVIKNMLGHVIAGIDNVNPKSELALIGQTRRFEVCYPKNLDQQSLVKANNCKPLKITPGKYTAQLVLLYGQNGQPSRQIGANASFWYLPLWFIIVVIIVLAVIVWLAYQIYRRFSGKPKPVRRR
jgi:hypothetical protein